MDTPNGFLMKTGVDENDIYFLVKRTIGGSDKWYVEKFETGLRVDCGLEVDTSSSATSTITAAHLASEEDVHCYADDNYQGAFTLDGSGEADIPNESDVYYQLGYFFTPLALTLPIEPTLQEGTAFGRKKRIIDIDAELFETEHIVMNGRESTFQQFGVSGSGSPLDVDGVTFTGRKKEEGFLGYNDKGQVTITKNRPGKLTVLGLGIKLSI